MARLINFVDGVQTGIVPTIGNLITSSFVTYPDDATFEAAEVGSPVEGNAYFNTTLNLMRYYNGTAWISLADESSVQTLTNKTIDADNNTISNIENDNIKAGAAIDATKIANGSVDNTEFQSLDGVTSPIQSQFNQHTLDIADNTDDISDLRTLSGTPDGATDLGTFTGTTIPDNSDNKEALQALETEVETKEDLANKGQPNGYAPLGPDQLIPNSYLPSYVDDVVEYANLAAFPVTGETGKIYIALDTNYQYRWSGSMYVQLASPGMSTSGVVTDNAITRYDLTTGLVVQASPSHLADDGALKLGATTAPHASALMDLESTTKGRLAPRMTQAQRDAISSPATGLEIFNTDTNKPNYYNGVVWTEVGSGSGSGGSGIAFLSGDNSNFENTVGSWAAYQDAAGVDPVDGTGGSPTVTIARSTSSPLFGGANGLITKPASNVQGEGVSVLNDIDIDSYNGLPIKVSFLVDASNANIVSTDMKVFAYDVTNGFLLGAVRNSTDGYIQNRSYLFEGWVYPNTNTQSIRLIIHFASTSALAYTVKIDQVMMSLADNVSIPLIQKFDITPTTNAFGTIVSPDFKWNIVGNRLFCTGRFTAGTTAASNAGIVLPFGYTADFTNANTICGKWWNNLGTATTRKTGGLIAQTASGTILFSSDDYTTAAPVNNALLGNAVAPTGSIIFFEFNLPIVQLTTNTIDGISSQAQITTSSTTSAGFIAFPTTAGQYGDATSFSAIAGRKYRIRAQATFASSGATTTTFVYMGVSTTSGNSGAGLVAGDSVMYTTKQTTSGTYDPVTVEIIVSPLVNTTYYIKQRADTSITNLQYAWQANIEEIPFSVSSIASGPVFLGTESWTHGEPNAGPASVRVYKHGASRRAIGVIAFTGVFVGTQLEITIPAQHAPLQAAYGGALIGTIRPMINGRVTISDSGSGTLHLAFFTAITTIRIAALGTSGSFATTSNLTATIPHTWGSGDYIFFDLTWVTE